MNKVLRLLPIFIFASTLLMAQDRRKADLAPCGSPVGLDPWLIEYRKSPISVSDRSEDTLYIGVQIHLVGKNNGTSYFGNSKLLDAFCRLNTDFENSNIRFYFKNDWNRINSTEWHQHQTIVQGIDMMLTNNVSGALNAYFVSDPAGNCGYNLPYGGVAMSHACSGPNDHTWAHEVGHALALPHPFIGWEGKAYNFNVPTPTSLTYDYTHFHETPDTILPVPLDTALVEYLDGSNCAIAADHICDTKADYLSYRWPCDAQNMSTVKQKDPNGAEFYSDGTLFMSYALDECQNRFSAGETATMRANTVTEKIDWVYTGQPQGNVNTLATLTSPINLENAPNVGTTLRWSPAANATHYVVQVSRYISFNIVERDLVTTDTSITLTQLLTPNTTFYWKVRAFNEFDACTNFTEKASFKAVPVSDVNDLTAGNIRLYPNIVGHGQPLILEVSEALRDQNATVHVLDMTGRMVWNKPVHFTGLQNTLDIPSINWPNGMYQVVFKGDRISAQHGVTIID